MEVQAMEECYKSFKPQQPNSSSWDEPRGLCFFTRCPATVSSASMEIQVNSAQLLRLCLGVLAATHVCQFPSALPKLREV